MGGAGEDLGRCLLRSHTFWIAYPLPSPRGRIQCPVSEVAFGRRFDISGIQCECGRSVRALCCALCFNLLFWLFLEPLSVTCTYNFLLLAYVFLLLLHVRIYTYDYDY